MENLWLLAFAAMNIVLLMRFVLQVVRADKSAQLGVVLPKGIEKDNLKATSTKKLKRKA
jgi:hypothetical protein